MTKFDSYLTQIAETNSISPAINQARPGTTPVPGQPQQNNTQNQNTPSVTPTAQAPQTTQPPTTQQKMDLEKLIKDFNDNKVSIQTPKDLEKYGLTLSK